MATVQQLQTYINQYTRDFQNKIRSLDQKLRALNVAYVQVQKDLGRSPPSSDASTTGTTVSGTNTIAKPADFVRLELVKVDGQELYKTTRKDVQIEYDIIPAGKPDRYYISGSNIYLVPTPDGVYSYELYYLASETVFTADSDSSALDSICDEPIVRYACYHLWLPLDPAKAQGARQDYEDLMNTARFKLYNDDENSTFSGSVRLLDGPKVVF